MQRPASLTGPIAATTSYLVLALIWVFGADLLIDAGVALDLVSLPGSGAWKATKLIPMLVATSLYIYAFAQRQKHDKDVALQQRNLIGDVAINGIAIIDETGVVQVTNTAFRRLLELSPQVEGSALIEPLIGRYVADPHETILPDQGEVHHTLQLRTGSRQPTEIGLQSRRLEGAGPEAGWILTATDLTASRHERSTRAIRLRALETATDGIAVASLELPDAPLIYVNKAFKELTGYDESEILGRNCRYLQGTDRQQPEIKILRDAFDRRQPATATLRNYRKDGSLFWSEIRLTPVIGDLGVATHYVAITRDVTALRESARQLQHLTCFDAETSLPNRAHFRALLGRMLADAPAFVLLMRLDIIGFMEIVGCYGEETGSRTLAEIGRRASATIPGAVIGLIGGDELGIAVTVQDPVAADALLRDLRAALAPEFALPQAKLHVTFSVGTAMAARGGDPALLLHQALVALIQSRRTRTGAVRGFTALSEDAMRRRIKLTSDLQQAVTERDFEMHYQPKIALDTGRIVGAEALIRWKHPVFGLQPPGRFIAEAEQSNHILAIGSWAVAETARFALRANAGRATPLTFSVNLSAVQFHQDGIVAALCRCVEENGADPAWITLEITETVFAGGVPDALRKLRALHDAGFGISIDDFGTGYANLQYLADFPITEIKIDLSFIRGIETSVFKRTIVGSVARIGASLGVAVVAEGIETPAERRSVVELGVKQGNGYHFSMPLPTEAFLDLVRDQPSLPALEHGTPGSCAA